ncbi:MAG: sigma-70 family RNA polymerase sigma factor [Acidobacteriota bacterium]|nr:sigma-70 family RNA polymerase sigma factor [Acidobacteriota bacterium]
MPDGTIMEALVGEVIQTEVDSRALTEREFENRLPAFSRLAFRVAYGVLHHREEAEDAAQEALLRAHRDFGKLRKPERFEAWLVRVTWRLAIDRQRSMKRREHREASAAPGSSPTAEQLAALSEFEDALYSAMDEIPEKLRLALVLTGIQGYDTAEAARLLGVPEGTVKSRVHSARRRLADKLRRFKA